MVFGAGVCIRRPGRERGGMASQTLLASSLTRILNSQFLSYVTAYSNDVANTVKCLPLIHRISSPGFLIHWYQVMWHAKSARSHQRVLEYARAQGCPWDAWTFALAAERGHLEVLIWAAEHGCPMDAKPFGRVWEVCVCAARSGSLAVLQWAREHDFEWVGMILFP